MLGEIIGEVTALETIALGSAIRDLARIQKLYGKGRWRKMKGRALMRLRAGGFGSWSCTGMRLTG